MKEQEFRDKLKELAKNYEKDKLDLAKEFANSNNPYKVGDTIKDHIGKGTIISWDIHVPFGHNRLPEMAYYCTNLTRKGTVNKREPKRRIYQSNIEV